MSALPPVASVAGESVCIDDLRLGVVPVTGRVIYVGVPFGNPDMLTVGGLRALGEADVVVLASQSLASLLDRPELALPEQRVLTLDDYDTTEARAALVAREAGRGRTVVRLVAGDPMTDSAIAHEAHVTAELGTPIDIVPAASALTAAVTFMGLDVTRDQPTYHRFAIGDKVSPAGSLVVQTCVEDLAELGRAALDGGREPTAPVAVSFGLGTSRQHTRTVRVKDLVTRGIVAGRRPESCVVVVFGPLAVRNQSLDTYETKPLFGWNVLVPRTAKATDEIDRRLRRYGASSYAVPTITVELPRNPLAMDKSIHGLVDGRYSWIVFTSGNAVRAVLEKLEEYGLDARAFSGLQIAAMSELTGAVLNEWGIIADLVPTTETCYGLVAEFPAFEEGHDAINRVFLPRADVSLETIVDGLAKLGWEAEEVTAYRAVRAAPPSVETRDAIKTGLFDAVVFTSSSTVRNLLGIAGKPPRQTIIAAIGPATAETCEQLGLHVDVLAPEPVPSALVDALAAFACRRRNALIAEGRNPVRPSESRRRRSS